MPLFSSQGHFEFADAVGFPGFKDRFRKPRLHEGKAERGSKLYFCASKSIKPNQEFHRCSAYKENRGSCSIRTLKQKIEKSRKRIQELDRLFSRIYEDNTLGKLSNERYARMSAAYESEQKELLAAAESDEQTVRDMEQERIDLHQFLNAMRECTDLKELTPTLVNTLIKRIEVHNSTVDENGVKHVPVDIHFTAVGIINIPDTEEILQIMEEIRTKPLRIA